MLDPDLTAVLRRRLVAFAIDAGLVSLITALVARSQFEKFPIDPAAWSTQQFDRLVELNDSFHRMQEIGDNQFVIDGPGMLITIVIGLILATIIFVLLPAIAGWSPGKKLTGIRVASLDGSRVGVGQLIARTAALVFDLVPFVIPGLVGFMMANVDSHRRRFGDRLAKTTVVDAKKQSAAPSAPQEPTAAPQRPKSAQEPATGPNNSESLKSARPEPAPSETVPPVAPATRQSSTAVMPEPIKTEPPASLDRSPSLEPPASLAGPQTRPTDLSGAEAAEAQRQKIDVTEFLDPEPEAPSTADLIEATGAPDAVAPDEPLLLSEPLPGNKFTVGRDPGTSSGPIDEPQAAVLPPALAGPEGRKPLDPEIDFEIDAESKTLPEPNDSLFGASSAPQRDQPAAEDGTGEVFPPPPVHRETGWEPPRSEPAPVWRPGDEPVATPTGETLAVDAPDPTLESNTGASAQPTSKQADIRADDGSAHGGSAHGGSTSDGPADDGPTDPVWSDDWQAWLYWDDKRRRWLRHDIDNDRWIPIS